MWLVGEVSTTTFCTCGPPLRPTASPTDSQMPSESPSKWATNVIMGCRSLITSLAAGSMQPSMMQFVECDLPTPATVTNQPICPHAHIPCTPITMATNGSLVLRYTASLVWSSVPSRMYSLALHMSP